MIDTSKVQNITLEELKLLIGFLSEVKYRRDVNEVYINHINSYNDILKNTEEQNKLLYNENLLLKEKIKLYENISKPFYDNFIFGFAVSTAVYLILTFVIVR